MKRLLSCIAMLAGLAGICTSAHAATPITINTSVQYKIKNVNSGLVLGISGASQAAGAKVVQWQDNGTSDHLWHFMPMGNGQYNIENMLTHQVLGVTNASGADGAQITQWADNGTSDHLWTVTQAADGNFLIQNVNSGKYLEVYMASTLNTATIDQWGSTGCTCQEWQLVNTQVSPYAAPRAVAGNGIFVHDPYMLRDSGGKYWLYGSHQTLATSTDGVNFSMYTSCTSGQMGGYAPNCPPIGPDYSSWSGLQTPKGWNSGANTDVWAPSLMLVNSTYYQYYSIPYLPSTGAEAVIGVATSSSPAGPWTDKGFVTKSWNSTTTSPPSGFWATTDNAIDPAPFLDASGNWWMAWGSWTDGTHLIQLDPATGLKKANTSVYTLAQRGTPSAGEEGPFIYYYNGYYYYFAPINVCCNGTSSTYRTIVGRSASVTGPYVDRGGVALTAGGGTILVSTHGNIIGPGGGSVFTDTGNNNAPTFVYHYYDGNNGGRATLGINQLGFTADGWPFLK
ncbi:MAG: family 43 glycosylhydrolase [Pseudomonadota bacterium]